MRSLLLIFLLVSSLSASATDSFQTALQLYQAGSPRLALARVERDQGPPSDQTLWYDWESLRLSLLSETQQAAEILRRAKLYSNNAPRDFLQKALGHSVWAQLELGENVAARLTLARLVWQFDLNPADLKWARRLVIRSYLMDHKPAEAYRAMLRYQQDYQPLPKEVATDFVQGLLAEGQVTEATTWFTALDVASPTQLALQMHAGLIAPEAALSQARAALQRNPQPAYAAIIADAAKLLNDDRQQIAALEQWLSLSKASASNLSRIQQLWQAYQREAERLGNQAQVLRGDDHAWLMLAASRGDDRLGARALYAYIAQQGSVPAQREAAQANLFAALVSAQLEGAAVLLFDAALWNGKPYTDAELQGLLMSLTANLPAAATRDLYFTAGRLQETRKNALAAAEYFAQAVLKSDLSQPDPRTQLALQRARSNLVQAGFQQDADTFYQRILAQMTSAQKKPAIKPKRKK